MKQYAVIVDAYHVRYGDDSAFASAFRARNVLPVAVMSTPRPLEKYVRKGTWHPEDYEEVHFHDGDFRRLLKVVRDYEPVCVVTGNERGVELTAAIVEEVMPEFGNVPGSAMAQRDKGEMARALERHGVPGPRTISSADPGEVADWIAASGLSGRPLIVKPPHSAGTEDVFLAGPGGWRPYFERILGSTDGFELVNETVIVQEYLRGREYIVDLYSAGGRHGLVDAWAYTKHDKGARIGIYDTVDILAPDDPMVSVLGDYAKRAATATGIRNGSTHAEVIMTADGPRLVELAARYSGSCMMLAGLLATGDNQIERTVRHALDGTFAPGYRLSSPVRTVHLSADRAGPVRHPAVLEAIGGLPTVRAMSVPPEGAWAPATDNATTRFGWVIQSGDSWTGIERDYRRIRELEAEWNRLSEGLAG